VVFDQEAGSNFAIENKAIVIITTDKSIVFVFHQPNFFFSRQIHSQLSFGLSQRLPALAKIDCAIDPLTSTPLEPQLVAQQGLARPAYVIIETRDRDGEVPGGPARLARGGIKKVEVFEYPKLGIEAILRIEAGNFLAFIVIDGKGHDFFRGAEFKVSIRSFDLDHRVPRCSNAIGRPARCT